MSSRVAVGTSARTAPSHGARRTSGAPWPKGRRMTSPGSTTSLTAIPGARSAVWLMLAPSPAGCGLPRRQLLLHAISHYPAGGA